MKNFTFLATVMLFCLCASVSRAQTPIGGVGGHHQRCNTTEYYENLFQTIPGFRAQFEANQARIERLAAERRASGARTMAINDTVPVVIHFIGSATQQTQVTDAILQSQITVLNEDFQGKNADSSRIPTAFKPLFGKMGLTFLLARRDPNGVPTNGIERRTNAITFAAGTADNAKRFANGGLDAWDPTRYLNLWVVEFTGGLLGISVFPGDPRPLNVHGFVCDYRAFGRGASYLYPEFNKGRTTTHELGHFWNLRHIWGDDNGSCANSDFPATGLPNGTDDTPNQAGSTFGNPDPIPSFAVLTDACSPTAPGIMYQNYMDYSDDIALVMFTNGQAARMEGALLVSPDRSPVLSSTTYLAPTVNDAGIAAIISPTTTNPSCDPTATPQVTLQNYGSATLTSVVITATVNGVVQPGYPINWTGSLASGIGTNLTLPAVTLAATGTSTIVISTSLPNGVADGTPSNDAATIVVTRGGTTPLPISENFESTTFPPAPWTVVSVNTTGTQNWIRRTPGNNSLGALAINNYSNSNGAIDDFRSGQYGVSPVDSVRIQFDVAYRPYDAFSPDSLLVLVSSDCGVTYNEVYKKWGSTTAGPNTLSTVLTPTTASYIPAAGEWRRETIGVPSALLAGGKFQVVFRSKSRFGNNIWIDNINVERIVSRDIRLTSVTSPTGNACGNAITPQVVVTNNGTVAINSFTVSYSVNGTTIAPATVVNTTLAPGASTTVTLTPSATAVTGNNTFVATVTAVTFATGTGDQELGNNSITQTFTVVQLRNSIQEGFEVVPPPGWTVFNPNADNTWVIANVGNNSTRSLFINNYDFNVPGNIDDARSPFLNISNYDSVFVSFDLAHRNYSGSNDSLKIMAITGCGSVVNPTAYAKAGTGLATAGSSAASYTTPLPGDWRRERVAIGRSVLGTGSNLQIAFRNINDYGNNIFIDNVSIVPLFRRDLQLLRIDQPGTISCSALTTPRVTVLNNGSETITGYKVQYSVDGGAPQAATVVSGVSIARFATATINLNNLPGTLSAGAHTIRVWSLDPVTVSGTGDENTSNDTLTRAFSVLPTVSSPLAENFVSATFPPANWTRLNPDGNITWQRNLVGNGNIGSAFVNTYNYANNGAIDDLVTPFVAYSGVDSVKLGFDLAAATYSYPGSTAIPIDTLEVLASRDCGATFTTVYKKWGADLQTINAPNTATPAEFIPNSPTQWRRETVDLSGFAGNAQVALVFRVKNNFENNIFIDNVDLTTQTLPTQLRQQGYLVYPTAFRESFNVRFFQNPTTLRYVRVVNSAGQLVWSQQYNGTANRQLSIDLTGRAAGVYFVELGYTDANRNVMQRVTKF